MKRFLISLSFILILVACTPVMTPVSPGATAAPIIKPTLSLAETSARDFKITDFEAVHSPVEGDDNKHLIFGNLAVVKPSADTPPDLTVFLGRWEGYSYSPPVKKDRKLVLYISEISEQGGKLYGWSGTNLQYPDVIGEVQFRVLREELPQIEFLVTWPDGSSMLNTFAYDVEKGIVRGQSTITGSSSPMDVYEMTRDQSFFVYKDYEQYLAGKGITTHPFRNPDLHIFSKGYMLYLPEGYSADNQKTWPLIFFLHGAGDRGDNLNILAKASPFMYICEKKPLPAIIAAPLLAADTAYPLFPEPFMDGALDEILSDYHVDARRIYLTGLSLGGEATYRFAMYRPEAFAAIAPLCAFSTDQDMSLMKNIKDIPVWAFHGADDTVVTLVKGQQPVNALISAGGNIKFTVLPGHDHDVWTDTYSDPAFYDWLLGNIKP